MDLEECSCKHWAKSFKDTAAFNQRAESSFILLTTAHLAVANRANAGIWVLHYGNLEMS